MSDLHAISHSVSVLVSAPAERAYAYLMDGLELGRWALGSFDTREVEEGVVRGVSLFDGQSCLVKPVGNPDTLRIEYHVGQDSRALVPRIVAQVVPGEHLGHEATSSVITLLAWRHRDMSDERWLQLQRCHEVEVLLIRSRLERWQASLG